jgi:hypothetical protein
VNRDTRRFWCAPQPLLAGFRLRVPLLRQSAFQVARVSRGVKHSSSKPVPSHSSLVAFLLTFCFAFLFSLFTLYPIPYALVSPPFYSSL